jgi:hypothetical protein
MSKITPTKNAPQGKVSTLKAKLGPASLVIGAQVVSLAVTLGLYYVIVFFAAVQVVPLTMGFVKSGTGVELDMALETIISLWIVPALFLVALVFALVLFTIKSIWRLRRRLLAAVSLWALGSATDVAEVSATTSLPRVAAARVRSTTSTKAA